MSEKNRNLAELIASTLSSTQDEETLNEEANNGSHGSKTVLVDLIKSVRGDSNIDTQRALYQIGQKTEQILPELLRNKIRESQKTSSSDDKIEEREDVNEVMEKVDALIGEVIEFTLVRKLPDIIESLVQEELNEDQQMSEIVRAKLTTLLATLDSRVTELYNQTKLNR